jgi:hypothetical protein
LSDFDRGTEAKVDGARTRAASRSRPATRFRRLVAGRQRRRIAFLAVASLLGTAAVAVAGPSGSFVDGGDSQQQANGIVKFGPINPDNGFPDWYRDSRGNEVEPCLQAADPNCNAPEVPDPDQPTSFPDNFPGEFFYWTGEAALTANGGNDVLAEFALEGTFAAEVPRFPDQMVFTRTRYRIRGGLQPDTDYKITNPYGVDIVHTDPGSTELFVTEDIGAAAGAFGDLFAGQVGPLLKWDTPGAPAGYLGDPAVPHTVTGSRFETNFVKIEGPGVGGPGNPNPCPGQEATGSPDCIYTDLFSIMGKESTRGGVDVGRATYSRAAAEDAKPQLDVLAESKADKDIIVRDTVAGTGRRFATTGLEESDGRYFAHIDVQGELPSEVEVVNQSDIPQTVKKVKVTDQLTGAALYDADTDNLHVTAETSDKHKPLTELKVAGYDKALSDTGAVDISETVPPNAVKVTSSGGGSVEIPVQIQGAGLPPLPLVAMAGSDQTVEQGVEVTLDGTTSTGNIDSYEWTGPDGIELTGADSPKATFTAPDVPGDYTFTLKVTGPDGSPPAVTSKEDTVVVHVSEVRAADARIAFAGNVLADNASITVPQNLAVTLDGGQSVGAAAFTWSQLSGPTVDLGSANQSKLTFTFPKTATPVQLQLQVRNPQTPPSACDADSCATAVITLNPEPDTLATTKARFVTNGSRWVIDGTATSTKSNKVTVYSGRALNPDMKIGTSDVLSDGTWSVDVRDSVIPTTTCACVTAVSDRGGLVVANLEKPQDLPPTTVDPGEPPAAPVATAAAAAPLAAAVPLAGARVAAAALAPARVAAPATVTAASVASAGVPVTVSVPTGASIVRLRVLTTANKALFSTFKKVKGGTKVKMKIKSAKLRRQLRAGKRYVLEVRAGTARNRLGKATRKVIRVR